MNVSLGRHIVKLIVGTGVSTIVGNVVRSTTPTVISPLDKVLIAVGQVALQGIVSDLVTSYVDKHIDEIMEKLNNTKENTDERQDKTHTNAISENSSGH